MLLRHSLAPVLMAVALVASPAAAQGTVEGAVTYDGRRVAMTQIYARETLRSPLDPSTAPPQVLILIADRPAPAKVVASRQAYYDAARGGELRGFLLTLEAPDKPPRLAIFVPGGYDDTSVPDIFEQIAVTELKREAGFVSGRLKSSEPREFKDEEARPDTPRAYTIDLRFRVPITPAPKATQLLSGEAARGSEQVTVAQRMLQLLRTGTTAQIKGELTADHPLAEALDSPDSRSMLATARRMLPAAATFPQTVERVVVYGDDAVVVAKDRDGGNSVWLRKVGAEWKVAPARISND